MAGDLTHLTSLLSTPISALDLKIEDTPIEPALAQFKKELERAGIQRLCPDFYLSTEWGVPFPSISIGIPFYLARPELIALHGEQTGYLEGVGPSDLLRFLRHEMGHVVNYAYELHLRTDWTEQFGKMDQPYLEEYRPEPFSRRHVRHLAGWYAQKHPDEDWAETFAVWMTPEIDWRAYYAEWPAALAKLDYCDRIMAIVNRQDPIINVSDHSDGVSNLHISVEEFYRQPAFAIGAALPQSLDGTLRAIFEDYVFPEDRLPGDERRNAADLIRQLERELVANVYRWTGHFPEATRGLVQHLAKRADDLEQQYPADNERAVTVAFTALVTSLAMNHVLKGEYLP